MEVERWGKWCYPLEKLDRSWRGLRPQPTMFTKDKVATCCSMKRPFSLTARIASFKFAGIGIWTMLKSQHNAWIHLVASITIVGTGLFFKVSSSEWCWLVLAIMAVWTAEALNTAFEFLADVASPEFHPLVKNSKDVAAGAVLISALGAIVIAILILGPYFVELFE